jgi:hypothetical protein
MEQSKAIQSIIVSLRVDLEPRSSFSYHQGIRIDAMGTKCMAPQSSESVLHLLQGEHDLTQVHDL